MKEKLTTADTIIQDASLSIEPTPISKPKPALRLKKHHYYFTAFVLLLLLVLPFFLLNLSKPSSSFASVPFSSANSLQQPGTGPDPFEEAREQQRAQAENAQKVLLLQAEKEDIQVEEAQVDELVELSLESYGMTEADLQASLDEYGVTYEEYREAVKERIAISQLVADNVDLDSVGVTDGEIDDYLTEYGEDFAGLLEPEDEAVIRARVGQVLIAQKQMELVNEYIESIQ